MNNCSLGRPRSSILFLTLFCVVGGIHFISQAQPKPNITSQPQNRSALVGANVSFAVVASGHSPLNYFWRFNGTNLLDDSRIHGTRFSTLIVSNLTLNDAGNYSVLVSNKHGIAISSNAVLTINTPPEIEVEPQGQIVPIGGTATLSVVANGQIPLSYRWRFNGSNLTDTSRIHGATFSTLVVSNLMLSDAGSYSVVVSNQAGIAISSDAVLSINTPPSVSGIPDQRTFSGVTKSVGFGVHDKETAVSLLMFSATSSDIDLVANEHIVIEGTGPDRTASITPSGMRSGTALITITVRDAHGAEASETFLLTVAGFTEIAVTSSLMGNGAVEWGDYNNDGRLDIFTTGKDANGATVARLFRNDGNDIFTHSGGLSEGLTFGAIACADYDGDGYLDVLINGLAPGGGSYRAIIYRNSRNGTFANVALNSHCSIGGNLNRRFGAVAWLDYDQDGDLDPLMVSCTTKLLRNSNGTFPNSGVNLNNVSAYWANAAVASADEDNDGDMDIFITGMNREVSLFRNHAGGFTSIPTTLPGFAQSSAAWGDFDNDGLLDMAVQGSTPEIVSTTRIYHNDGGGNFSNINAPLQAGTYASVRWGDYNNDGNLDLLVGSAAATRLYRNEGNNVFADAGFILPGCDNGDAAFGDYDNDGDLDIILMGTLGGGQTKIYRNDGALPNSLPTAPKNLAAAKMGNSMVMSWGAATDSNQTNSWTYNLRVGTSPGSGNIMSSMSDAVTGQRRLPALGNAGMRLSWMITNLTSGTYYWSVQAIDHTFAGSTFAEEQRVTIGPIILQHPTKQTVLAGEPAVFSVIATNDAPPLSYQWRFNGVNLSMATNETYVVTNAQLASQGNYSVVVSDPVGSVSSSNAFLTVLVPPSISQQPQSRTNVAGSTVLISAAATGTPPLTYQWFFDNTPLANGGRISGANSSTLSITSSEVNDSGNYWLVVSNAGGMATSSVANLIVVLVPPSLTLQPQSQTKLSGSNFGLSVSTIGSLPLSYQWFFENAPVANGGRISGANGPALSVLSGQTNDSGTYFVIVTNAAGSVTSSIATMNIGIAPVITMPPLSHTNLIGSNVTFNVVADGTAPLSYQWRFKGTNLLDDNRITGSTTSTLSISNLLTTFAGTYTVVVTNLFGSVTSASAGLTVLVPPTFNVQPVGRSVPVGMPTTFSASITGTAPLTYQWQFNGSNIFNATNSSFSIASVTTNDFGIYTLIASNAVGVATSADALLTPGKIVAWGRNDFGQTVVPANLTNVVMLAGGGSGANPGHSLALRTDGSVVAWGNNSAGQTNVPAGLTNVVSIAAGGLHSMALRSDGKVFVWGSNGSGQTNVPNLSNIVAIAAGASHSLALRSDGKLIGWGYQVNVPSSLADFRAIACGAYHGLAIRADGTLATWGNNTDSQNLNNPPAGMNNLTSIAGGLAGSVVLRENGTAISWGFLTNVPASLTNGIMVTAGDRYAAALRSSGTAAIWGQNAYSYGLINVPAAGSNLVSIAGGGAHMLGLIGDDAPLIVQPPIGSVTHIGRDAVLNGKAIGAMPLNYQWRFNGVDIPDATNATFSLLDLAATNAGDYQLVVSNAFGIATSVSAPLMVLDNPTLTFLAQPPALQTNYQGSKVTLKFSVSGNGPLNYQWRLNGTNIAGATNQEFVFDPVLFEHAGVYSAVISNQSISRTSGALTQRVQTIRTWGYSDSYYGYYYSQNPIVTNVVSVAAGLTHFLALRADGKVQGWGINQFGEINPPAALSNATVTAIAAGYNFSLALRSDGIPSAWGYNNYGQTNIPASATNVTAIACGYSHSLALRSDGTAVGWGINTIGQINVPVAATNLVAVAAGQNHSIGLKADGTMVVWGHLGIGLTGMPRDATNIIAIAAGTMHSVALRTNGTVIAWGSNTQGQTNVPLGLSNVVAVSASGMHSVALRSDGTVVYWGSYAPSGASGSATTPSDLENFIQIADGGDRSIGILGTRAPAITIQPFNRVVLNGSNTVLIAKAVGAQPVSYQWIFNGANIVGATNDSLILTNVEFAQAGAYQLSVSNRYGTSASKPAKLVFSLPLGASLDAASFPWSSSGDEQWFGQTSTTHDEVDAARSGSISHNRNSVLQTSVTGPAQISFWWKVSSETVFDVLEFRLNGAVQAVISGEEDWQQQTFSIPSGLNTLQWRYAKDASSSAGQDAGWVDQFAYTPGPPIITVQPVGKTVNMGSNVQFIVTATGVGPFNYQWRKNVTNAVGINSATLVLNNVGRAHSGIYFLTITNAGGSVTSSNAVLNVLVPQRLGTPSIQPDGTLLFAARDADGNSLSDADLADMQIQTSTNLFNWETLPGALILTNGNLQFVDDAKDLPNRFYRIVEAP